MVRYSTILFDMFDTLVQFDRSRLPAVRIGDREVRSSVAELHALAAPVLGNLDLATFYEGFLWAYQEAERLRAAAHREVPARERFELVYRRVGVNPATVPAHLTERLLDAHMRCLAHAAEPVPGQHELLGWLAGRYRLGVVSNFDYTPTVHHILAEGGILDRFETVVVSDSVGWRKPRAAIFEQALRRMDVSAGECLFVGDRPDIDVAGAKGIGMDAAWLNGARAPLPPGVPAPDLDLAGLDELRQALEMHEKAP